MNLKKLPVEVRIQLIIAVLSLVMGLIIGYSFASKCIEVPSFENIRKDASQKALARARKESAIAEQRFTQQIDSLHRHATQLQQQLSGTKQQLKAATQQSKQLERKLWSYAGPVKDSVVTQPAPTRDNWREDFSDYIAVQDRKDSLCSDAIDNLETQVANRDSVIQVQDVHIMDTKTRLEQSFAAQETLVTTNAALRKSLKKQKRKNLVQKIGMVVVGGVAGFLLLRK